MEGTKQQFHFVLVHGAWCWYKLKPLLESAGHRVSALDLAASGIDARTLHQVPTMEKYSQPLLELMATMIPVDDKVVLVGHSLGGLRVAIFLTAFMPDKVHRLSYTPTQLRSSSRGLRKVARFLSCGSPEEANFICIRPQLHHLQALQSVSTSGCDVSKDVAEADFYIYLGPVEEKYILRRKVWISDEGVHSVHQGPVHHSGFPALVNRDNWTRQSEGNREC